LCGLLAHNSARNHSLIRNGLARKKFCQFVAHTATHSLSEFLCQVDFYDFGCNLKLYQFTLCEIVDDSAIFF